MQALISTTSDLYAKRLVKAIHAASEHGVYLDAQISETKSNPRVRAVRWSGYLSRIVCDTNQGSFLISGDHWAIAFSDGYGRQIVATRRAK